MINSALRKLLAVYVTTSNMAFESFLIKWNPILHGKAKMNFNHFLLKFHQSGLIRKWEIIHLNLQWLRTDKITFFQAKVQIIITYLPYLKKNLCINIYYTQMYLHAYRYLPSDICSFIKNSALFSMRRSWD